MINEQIKGRCPRCGVEVMRTWQELSEEQREVVRRLPASANFTDGERRLRHRWCVRCWHEETGGASHDA